MKGEVHKKRLYSLSSLFSFTRGLASLLLLSEHWTKSLKILHYQMWSFQPPTKIRLKSSGIWGAEHALNVGNATHGILWSRDLSKFNGTVLRNLVTLPTNARKITITVKVQGNSFLNFRSDLKIATIEHIVQLQIHHLLTLPLPPLLLNWFSK